MLDYVYCQLTFAWRIFPRTREAPQQEMIRGVAQAPGVDRAAKALSGWQHEWGYARTEDFWLLQASALSARCS